MNATATATATEVFSGLNEVARITLDGDDYVIYSDSVSVDIIHADEWDGVDIARFGACRVPAFDDDEEGYYRAVDHNSHRYSAWCADTCAVNDRTLFARILAVAGIDHVNSGACGSVHAA